MESRRWVRTAVDVARHPSLWVTAVVQAHRLAPPRWWCHAPFVPVPDPAYARFRLETQYGADGEPTPQDVVTYLRWCRRAGR